MITRRDIEQRSYGRIFKSLIVLLSAVIAPVAASAAGFSNFTQGAGSMGVGNATVAHSEGLSSIFFNPALQLEFEGVNMDVGFTLVRPEKKLESSVTYQTYESESSIYTPLHMALSYRVSDTTSIALNVNNSFGLGSEFPEDTVFRYLTTISELTTWDVNTSFAYQVHDRVVLAAGVRVIPTNVSLEQMVPLQSFGLPDGRQKFDANDIGYGWNAGAIFSFTDNWSLGVSYRSKVDIELTGDVSFDLPQSNNILLNQTFPKTSAESDFELPAQYFVGISHNFSKKIVIEAAARFEQYSSYDTLEVSTQLPVAGQSSRSIPKHWKDVWAYMLGISYQTDRGYRFSTGYLFEENPVPDETFEPSVSGLDKHTITCGIAKQFGSYTGRISYAHDFYENRDIINHGGTSSLVNGRSSQQNQSLALTLSRHF